VVVLVTVRSYASGDPTTDRGTLGRDL